MNKRKIMVMAMALCMVAILAIGGTLAYFTDNEAKKNVITVGEIDIALNEDFDDEAPLVPSEDAENNFVKKEVDIDNEGSSPAYVRLLIAYEDTKDVGSMAHIIVEHPYALDGVVKDVTKEDRYVIPGGNGDWLQIQDKNTGTVYTVAFITLSEAIPVGGNSGLILKGVGIHEQADNAWAEIVGTQYEVLVLAQGAQQIDDQNATYSLNTSYGFTMDATADEQVAQMFTQAGLGEFVPFTYTSEGAWTPGSGEGWAWKDHVEDPTPITTVEGSSDAVGDIIDSNDSDDSDDETTGA